MNGLDTPRRMSGELISMKGFLSANKVSLAVMQKQLYDTAQMQYLPSPPPPPPIIQPTLGQNQQANSRSNYNSNSTGAVGPLAIASEKFER